MALRVLAAVGVAVLLVAGCGQTAEQAVDQAVGQVVESATEQLKDQAAELGLDLPAGVSTELPANFPADIPLPPEGELLAVLDNPDGLTALFTVSGLTAEAFDAYVASVKAAGYDSEISATDLGVSDEGFTKAVVLVGNGSTVSITAFVAGGTGQITIVVGAE